ncbi:MAG: CPBP family intramembrane metalloprotease, partial [Opitutales bacterium]|nr:CPBP family intramembrane metalloprotease [Opitutales bacterium]
SGPVFLTFLHTHSDFGQYIASKGIEKILERIRLLFTVGLLPFFFKKCGIASLKAIGYDFRDFNKILSWAVLGAFFMCAVEIVEILVRSQEIQISVDSLVNVCAKLPKFLFCALVVSILEEVIFRGIMLRIFYTALPVNLAIVLSSLFFAYLHIGVPRAAKIASDAVTIFSGFKCILPVLFGFMYKFNVLLFLKVTILGIILSKLTLKYFSLNRAIGFHSGVVFAMFILNILF